MLAEGHWGRALREYMRDYNHWATVGVLSELLAQPDNRVTLADEHDQYGLPIARFDSTLCENDKTNMAFSARVIREIVPNLFICDGSVCPTQGSANPALTIMALASRLAERLATRKVDPRGARVQSELTFSGRS